MSAVTKLASLVASDVAHLDHGLTDECLDGGRQVERAAVQHGDRDVALSSQIAPQGHVLDAGLTRQLRHGLALERGLSTDDGPEGGIEPFGGLQVVVVHAIKATETISTCSRMACTQTLTVTL